MSWVFASKHACLEDTESQKWIIFSYLIHVILLDQLNSTGGEELSMEGNVHTTHTHTNTHHTDTHSSLFQSTGQSDQLIGDFEGATWSRAIGRAGSGCWLPGTLVHVPVCSPQPWRLANEETESNSSSVAWPCQRAWRSERRGWRDGWMDDNFKDIYS